MVRTVLVIAIVCGAAHAVTASPAQPLPPPYRLLDAETKGDPPWVAVGVNLPVRWFTPKTAFGASLFVRLPYDLALRANYATYDPNSIAAEFSGTDYHGDVTDLGVGLVYVPVAPLAGPTVEVGVVRRASDTVSISDLDDTSATKSTTWAARALVGGMAPIGPAFIAFGVGASIGREVGTEGPPGMPSHVDRRVVSLEGYLRWGILIGGQRSCGAGRRRVSGASSTCQ